MRVALADKKLELGTFKALGAWLGVSPTTARRLTLEGPSASWSRAQTEAFASRLYAKLAEAAATRAPEQRATLERKRKLPKFTLAARVAAAQRLEREIEKLERRRPCEPGSWTPRAELARDLGVTSIKLARWIASGRVSEAFMPTFAVWAQERTHLELRQMAERGEVERLIREAKKPAFEHALPGQEPRQAPRAPDLVTDSFRTESEQHSGYRWTLRVEQWCSFELIDKMVRWVLSRRRPPGMLAKPARWWIVTGLVSIYHPNGRSTGRGKHKKYPGAFRQFEPMRDRERGSNLGLGIPVSSRSVKNGGLERAAALFRSAMLEEHCEHEGFVFVHGVIVNNWRLRTETEQQNYRDREKQRRLEERRRQERRGKLRRSRARKKKTTGRRSTRATASTRKRRTPR